MNMLLLFTYLSCILLSCNLAATCTEESCVQEETNLLQVETGLHQPPKRPKLAQHDAERQSNDYFWFWGHRVRRSTGLVLAQTGPTTIDPPSSDSYVLKDMDKPSYSQWGQDLLLMPILEKLGKGFFVESGALDGETDSNTLLLERTKGWTGLLVEPSPRMYPSVRKKNRHAYTYNGC